MWVRFLHTLPVGRLKIHLGMVYRRHRCFGSTRIGFDSLYSDVNVIVSDFDNTLFKRNFGLLDETVGYLEKQGLPIYIVTYRAESQQYFIEDVLSQTSLNVVGYGYANSREKDPVKKFAIVRYLQKNHNIVEALDDDLDVVLGYLGMGINARQV